MLRWLFRSAKLFTGFEVFERNFIFCSTFFLSDLIWCLMKFTKRVGKQSPSPSPTQTWNEDDEIHKNKCYHGNEIVFLSFLFSEDESYRPRATTIPSGKDPEKGNEFDSKMLEMSSHSQCHLKAWKRHFQRWQIAEYERNFTFFLSSNTNFGEKNKRFWSMLKI